MTKRLLILCFFFLSFIELQAQSYGNEWINYSQKYYKIKIAQNGIYKINYTILANAGIPVNTIDPRKIQIFNKGIEQKIYIEGEKDGIFNTTDFIELYAQKNDGSLDSLVYTYTSFVPNPYYSLVNDTAVYYLTWNNSTANKRMIVESDVNFNAFTPSNYFLKEEIHDFHTGYYAGETNIVAGTDSRYTRSEGWFDANTITLGATVQYTNLVNTSNVYFSGPNAIIKTVAVGASKDDGLLNQGNADHHLQIDYKGSSGAYNQLIDTLFKGYESNRFTSSINPTSLGTVYTDFKFTSIANPNFSSNRTAVSYICVKYPHTFDLEGKNSFMLYLPDATAQAKSLLTITNFNANGTVRFYDLSNGKRIEVVSAGSNYNLLVPNSGNEKKCYITSDNSIINIASIQPVTYSTQTSNSAQFTNYSALAVDSAYIIVTNKSLITEANNYKNYRAFESFGGFHNVVIADIDELYDQFAYGVVKSPLSIRRFADFLFDTYPSPPQHLFLLGKSIHLALCRQNATSYANCLVPSFGNPSSDNLFTSKLNNTNIAPAIATGRLAAKNENDVNLYLNKIKQYENRNTNPPAEWMKYILHFGGGTDIGEQTSFKNYLNNYKAIIQDTLFGGVVIKEFFKNSSAPIQINLSDTLKNLMNEGVSLMTFFGHASGSGFDQNIDDVNNYNPSPGHYPFVLANSCYSGDFHSYGGSTSETFMLVQNKGMIGFLGSVGLGEPRALNLFSNEFYSQIAEKSYNKSIGECIRKTIFNINSFTLTDTLARAVCYEMSLHGDPALKLNTHPLPDYQITNSDVYFDLTTQPNFVTVYATITNIGKATNDSIIIELERMFPNGEKEMYIVRTKSPKYKDTISFKLPVDFTRGIGLNKIRIMLDRNLEVAELNENNNTTNPYVDLLITGGDVIPIYPYEFAIIPTDTVTLKASTANPLAAAKNYIFQLDTIDTFNSPFLQTFTQNSLGGVIKWKPLLLSKDSTVYYWRASPDSIDITGYKWRESSFQYINNKRGWGQAHFFQYKNNSYEYVKFNRSQRKFDFVNDVKSIQCINAIPPAISDGNVIYKINGEVKYSSSWARPGLTFAVIDPVSGNALLNIPQLPNGGQGLYGSITGYKLGHAPENAFDFFQNDSIQQTTIANFINNSIPNGYYVLAYSQDNHKIPHYNQALYSAFESLGSAQIRNVPTNRPYIFYGRKGNPIGQSKELIGATANSILQFDTTLTTNWDKGFIASPVIGPATSWGALHWRQHHIDGASTNDSIYIRVIGIKSDGTESNLVDFPKDSTDIINLSFYVNAAVYNSIRLVAYMADNTLHTPPQLERWQVLYAPIPEAALNAAVGYAITKDTLQEGESLSIRLPIQNISETNFNDSLLITYWIQDANNVKHILPDKLKKNPFVPNELLIDTITISSIGYEGNNSLWVEVNPINQTKSQVEQYHFNNIVRIPFYTNIDKTNPLLDVTFDGVHILNNDIVSSLPNILIQLKDENKFLALNDTNDFRIYITKPNSTSEKRIYFSSEMTFIPAQLPNNSCKINFTPNFGLDGTYQLRVQAQDVSNNASGAENYLIKFEIINKTAITEVINYPNPFSTSTKFVFTLTGYKVPTDFKIQIMSITGKVVREIFKEELGPLHVGRNITEFAWDGKDQFGDQLANGVYLYRVITRIDGEAIEKKQTEADQYFKKGWGKMYLMR